MWAEREGVARSFTKAITDSPKTKKQNQKNSQNSNFSSFLPKHLPKRRSLLGETNCISYILLGLQMKTSLFVNNMAFNMLIIC